jgi:hypothetical protein
MLLQRGLQGLVPLLVLPVSLLLWHLREDPARGLELGWRHGDWYVCRAGDRRAVEPGPRTVVTAWLIYLDLIPLQGGRRESVWIYADGAERNELRRLRARLALLQPGGS